MERQQFTPLAFTWQEPDIMAEAAPLQNLWSQPQGAFATLEPFGYRLHSDGSLEFKGHLDAQDGAVSGSVALTLPDADDPKPSYRLTDMGHGDQYFDTVIIDVTGLIYTPALGRIYAVSGNITITWPVF